MVAAVQFFSVVISQFIMQWNQCGYWHKKRDQKAQRRSGDKRDSPDVDRLKLLWTCTRSCISITEEVTGMGHMNCWSWPTNPIAAPLGILRFCQSNTENQPKSECTPQCLDSSALHLFLQTKTNKQIKKPNIYLMHSSLILQILSYMLQR